MCTSALWIHMYVGMCSQYTCENGHLSLIFPKKIKFCSEPPPHHDIRASSTLPLLLASAHQKLTQHRGAQSSLQACVCIYIYGYTWVCMCVWGSPRWAVPLSAPIYLLCRPKMKGTTTSSMSCWLDCLPSSGRPSAFRRPRPTTT